MWQSADKNAQDRLSNKSRQFGLGELFVALLGSSAVLAVLRRGNADSYWILAPIGAAAGIALAWRLGGRRLLGAPLGGAAGCGLGLAVLMSQYLDWTGRGFFGGLLLAAQAVAMSVHGFLLGGLLGMTLEIARELLPGSRDWQSDGKSRKP